MIVLRFGLRTLLAATGLLIIMGCSNPYIVMLGVILVTYNTFKIVTD